MVEKTPAISLIPTPSAECGLSTEIIDESRLCREERDPDALLESWPGPRCLPSSLVFLLLSLFLLLEKKDEAMLLVMGATAGLAAAADAGYVECGIWM